MSNPTLLHGGKIGDVIFTIPAINAMAKFHKTKIDIILHTGAEWSISSAKAIEPLLKAQDSIGNVTVDFSGPKVYFDNYRAAYELFKRYYPSAGDCVDLFRYKTGIASHLIESISRYLIVYNDYTQPFINNVSPNLKYKDYIVLHSHRENSTGKAVQPVERYTKLLDKVNRPVVIIGTTSDINDIDYLRAEKYCPTDMLDAASVIAGSYAFMGGEHSPAALAMGLWKKSVVESFSPLENTCPLMPDNLWINMQLSTDKEIIDFLQ